MIARLTGTLLLLVLLAPGARTGGESAKVVPADLQGKIDTAIERGAAAIRKLQHESGAIQYNKTPLTTGTIGHHQGTTALGCLALLHAGAARDDPAVARGVEWILRMGRGKGLSTHHRWVYASGLVIWLLAEVDPTLYRPEITALASRLSRGAASDGHWGYYSGGLGTMVQDLPNMSTTQYAVLGLREAGKAGIPVPRRTWEKLERTLRNRQLAEGGWGYTTRTRTATFTSSAIGLASLIIARAAVAKDEAGRRAALEGREVQLALACLARRFDEALRPRWATLDAYGLYAAERAGVVAGVRRFGRRDWYREGAVRLLEAQREDGSWAGDSRLPPAVSTSFAILFLARATKPIVPVATESPDATTGGPRGLDAERAVKLSEKDFRDLVDSLLAEMAAGQTPAGALEKIESLAPRVLPHLVGGLEDEKPEVRRAAITALHALRGTRRGYDPEAPEKARREAIARWHDALR